MSPAACRYLRIKLDAAIQGSYAGPYCSYLQQFIVSGGNGTCVGCENFAEPEPQCFHSRVGIP